MRSGTPSKERKSRRHAQALASVPGRRATVLEAFAATEGRPTDTMAGMVTKEPPPAAAFKAPASRPAPNRMRADPISMRGSVQGRHADRQRPSVLRTDPGDAAICPETGPR